MWDLDTGQALATLEGHDAEVGACAFAPDGERAISASHDGALRIWDLTRGRAVASWRDGPDYVYGCAVTADGIRAISVPFNGAPKVWDMNTGRGVATLGDRRVENIRGCAFTPDGEVVVAASHDGSLRQWELATGRELAPLPAHGARVFGCAVTEDGALISASEDGTLRAWHARRRVCLCTHHGDDMFLSVAATTGAIIAGDSRGTVWILDWPPLHPDDVL
jgi:WD40 repeat protein